jgi:hypothetical protein
VPWSFPSVEGAAGMLAGCVGLVYPAVVGWRQCATGPADSLAAAAAVAGAGIYLVRVLG